MYCICRKALHLRRMVRNQLDFRACIEQSPLDIAYGFDYDLPFDRLTLETNNFYEKNKGRTKEGKQKRWTIILAILFAILSIALGILYMA